MAALATTLVQLVLGDDATVVRAAASRSVDQWRALCRLAVVWRVLPELRHRVMVAGVSLDASVARELRTQSVAAAAHSTLVSHRAATVLLRLDDAGIAALAFKGVGVIANLYRGTARRMLSDVDILIRPGDVGRACRVLADDGFVSLTDRFEDYLAHLDTRPHEGGSSGNQCLVLRDADGLEVDLHWRIGAHPPAALTADRLLEAAESVTLYGHVIRVANPLDAMTLTVHHALRDNFDPAATVKDLVDLRTWWREQPTRWTVADAVTRARTAGLAVPWLALWRILERCDGGVPMSVAELSDAISAREREDATLLELGFWWQVEHGPLNGDLLRLLNPAALGRFLARRLRHRERTQYFDLQVATALGLPRPSLAARTRQLARALAGLTPRRLAVLRALLRAHRMS